MDLLDCFLVNWKAEKVSVKNWNIRLKKKRVTYESISLTYH